MIRIAWVDGWTLRFKPFNRRPDADPYTPVAFHQEGFFRNGLVGQGSGKTMNPVQFGEYTGNTSSQTTQPMKSMSMILLMVCLLSENASTRWVPTTEFMNKAKIMPDRIPLNILNNIAKVFSV